MNAAAETPSYTHFPQSLQGNSSVPSPWLEAGEAAEALLRLSGVGDRVFTRDWRRACAGRTPRGAYPCRDEGTRRSDAQRQTVAIGRNKVRRTGQATR